MSCPDWKSLESRRDHQPEAWEQALEHADGCEPCRIAALAAEPTRLFRRLPALEVEADEVAAMKRAVASMRRAEAVQRASRPWASAWMRAAAVAALITAAVLMQGLPGIEPDIVDTVDAVETATRIQTQGALEQMPLVEYVDPSHGSLIQMVDDDFSLVVVLPSRLDV